MVIYWKRQFSSDNLQVYKARFLICLFKFDIFWGSLGTSIIGRSSSTTNNTPILQTFFPFLVTMVFRIQNKYWSGGKLFYGFIGNLKNLLKNKHENLLKGALTREASKHTEHIWMKALQEKKSSSEKIYKNKIIIKSICWWQLHV